MKNQPWSPNYLKKSTDPRIQEHRRENVTNQWNVSGSILFLSFWFFKLWRDILVTFLRLQVI